MRANYDYSSDGVRTKSSGDIDADFGFTGFYVHRPTGLNLAFYRAYDSETSSWLSRDPIEEKGGTNLFAYVNNNPVRLIDPLGLIGWPTGIGVAVGLLDPRAINSRRRYWWRYRWRCWRVCGAVGGAVIGGVAGVAVGGAVGGVPGAIAGLGEGAVYGASIGGVVGGYIRGEIGGALGDSIGGTDSYGPGEGENHSNPNYNPFDPRSNDSVPIPCPRSSILARAMPLILAWQPFTPAEP